MYPLGWRWLIIIQKVQEPKIVIALYWRRYEIVEKQDANIARNVKIVKNGKHLSVMKMKYVKHVNLVKN